MKELYNDVQEYLIDAEYSTDIDKDVKKKVTDFFRSLGWKVYNTKQLCSFDLLIIKGDKQYLIELKERRCSHTKYTDNTCEAHKLDALQGLAPLSQCFLISVYQDNTLRISRFDWESHIEERYASKQTDFPDKRLQKKQLLCFDKYTDIKYDKYI